MFFGDPDAYGLFEHPESDHGKSKREGSNNCYAGKLHKELMNPSHFAKYANEQRTQDATHQVHRYSPNDIVQFQFVHEYGRINHYNAANEANDHRFISADLIGAGRDAYQSGENTIQPCPGHTF